MQSHRLNIFVLKKGMGWKGPNQIGTLLQVGYQTYVGARCGPQGLGQPHPHSLLGQNPKCLPQLAVITGRNFLSTYFLFMFS